MYIHVLMGALCISCARTRVRVCTHVFTCVCVVCACIVCVCVYLDECRQGNMEWRGEERFKATCYLCPVTIVL